MYVEVNQENRLSLRQTPRTKNNPVSNRFFEKQLTNLSPRDPSMVGLGKFYEDANNRDIMDTKFGESASPKFNNSLFDENEVPSPDPQIDGLLQNPGEIP